MSEVLKVVSLSETMKDKNGVNYKVIGMETSGVKMVRTAFGNIAAKVKPRSTKKAVYEVSYLQLNPLCKELGYIDKDGKPDYSKLKAKDYAHIPKEFEFSLGIGDIVLGDIITREVEEYEITDVESGEVRTTNLYTRIVLGDTDSPAFQSEIVREFRRQGHELIQKLESFEPQMKEEEEEQEIEIDNVV